MLRITNPDLFNQIVQESLAKVQNDKRQNDKRWTNAINKAVSKIEDETQANFMEFDAANNQLIIWSQRTDKVYSSNGICQCEAFFQGSACWHRALARLIRLYFESLNTPPSPVKVLSFPTKHEDTTAIYSKRQPATIERVGGIRI